MSIYNTIRSSKVSTGSAPNFASMRTFDPDAQICVNRANVSDYGIVGVSRDTINTQAPGCSNALNRMVVENISRPRYSTYINSVAMGDPSVGDNDLPQSVRQYQSKPYYDTQLGFQYTRPVLPENEMHPSYKLSNIQQGVTDATQLENNATDCFMQRRYDGTNCLSNQ